MTDEARPRPATANADVAVCTLVHHRETHLLNQLAALELAELAPLEVIVVRMGEGEREGRLCSARSSIRELHLAGDGPLPLAAARNAAAAVARAGTLVFLDVDCIPALTLVREYRDACARASADVVSGLVRYLAEPVAVVDERSIAELAERAEPHERRPTVPEGVLEEVDHRLFWSLSFAMSADRFAAIGGFDERFVGYGGEDTDFAFSARAAGARHLMFGGALAFHQWHEHEVPPLTYLDEIVGNARHFHSKWGTWPMEGWLAEFAKRGLVEWTPTATTLTRTSVAAGR